MATQYKKRKQVTCYCEAYPFPHRIDSGECRLLYNREVIPAPTIAMSHEWFESGHSYKDFG